MEITIDEWVVHYISDPKKHKIVSDFLEKVLKKCDKFVTIKGEGLDHKMWRMAKKSGYWKPESRKLAKWFMLSFRLNNEKFHILEGSNAMSLPPELEQETPQKDLYLIKAAITTDSFILTTDQKLKEKLSHRQELTIRITDEFLSHYDCQRL